MAFTLGALTEIDDTAVDAESPITESLMTSLRDNAYWIVAGTTQTTETTAGKVLETTGGAGDMQWTAATSLNTIDGTKGFGTIGTSSGAPYQIASVTGKNLLIHFCIVYTGSPYTVINGTLFINQTDESYVINGILDSGSGANATLGGSGTLTGSFVNIAGSSILLARITGGNYEFYESTAGSGEISYIWL
jgi:hypothetical protein